MPQEPHARTASRHLSRGLAREQALLSAATELVREVGYHATTVDSIAARARSSKATIYRRWPAGKPEIVADALRRSAEPTELARADSGSVRGDLLNAVRSMARSISGEDGISLVGLVEGIRDDATVRSLVQDQIEFATAVSSRAIAGQAHERGEGIAQSAVAAALETGVSWLVYYALMNGELATPTVQRRLVDNILLPVISGKETC